MFDLVLKVRAWAAWTLSSIISGWHFATGTAKGGNTVWRSGVRHFNLSHRGIIFWILPPGPYIPGYFTFAGIQRPLIPSLLKRHKRRAGVLFLSSSQTTAVCPPRATFWWFDSPQAGAR